MSLVTRLVLIVVAAVAVVAVAALALMTRLNAPDGGLAPLAGMLVLAAGLAGVVGGVMAARAARSVASPLRAVVDAAHALRQEQPVGNAATGVAECDAAITAIADAQANVAVRADTADHARDLSDETLRTCEAALGRVQRLQAVGRLGGAVAHDFNNVLGVVSNSLLLLQRLPSVEAHRMPLAAIERASARGSALTRQLQRLARPSSTGGQGAVSLHAFVEDLAELLRTAAGSTVRVVVDIDPDAPPVRVDAPELELALVNLVLNARDAMPAGGTVTLSTVPPRRAEVADRSPADWLVLSVADTGEGIDPAVAPRLFERFATTRPGRAGLGLAQVAELCRGAGGQAVAGTGPDGRGTEIRLLLPVVAPRSAAAPAHDQGSTQTHEGAPSTLSPGLDRLLLVEDNESLGEVTAALLSSYGYHVVRARHAADALARLGDPGARFDVVLSDVVMPGEMDGLELARRLRRDHPELPVVLISGYSAALSPNEDFEMLYKPYSPGDLVRLLRKVVAEHA